MMTYQSQIDDRMQHVAVLTAWDGQKIRVASTDRTSASQQCMKEFNEYERRLKSEVRNGNRF